MDAPAVAVSGDGKKIAAAWMDLRNGKDDRRVVWCQAGAPEGPLAGDSKLRAGRPSLVIDPAGTVHALWEEGDEIKYTNSLKGARVVTVNDSSDGKCGFVSATWLGTECGAVYEGGGKIRFKRVSGEPRKR